MMRPDIQENLMRRYLLGNLPESEANELELQIFRDDEKFEEMWEIENQLVDGYVRSRLSAAEHERFERYYQASSVHSQRVAVARNLVEEADGSRADVIPATVKVSWRSGYSLLSWQSALAATVLLFVICSTWLLLDRSRLRHEHEQLRAERQSLQDRENTLSQQLTSARAESQRLASEIERLRLERNDNAVPPTQPERTQRPTIYSILLAPMLMRSGDSTQTAKFRTKPTWLRSNESGQENSHVVFS
jgi:hypothetical protein